MIDFRKIDEARKILGLDEEATLQEIKEAYRKLALKYHPDRRTGKEKKESENMLKKINHAWDILIAYCTSYRYSFKEKDVKRVSIDKQTYKHLKRFYEDWWGHLDI